MYQLGRIRQLLNNQIILQLVIFACFYVISVVIFWSRLQVIFTSYGLGGIDTDPTLWYYWAKTHALLHGNFFIFDNSFLGFPYGYDLSSIPLKNILYDTIVFINYYLKGSSPWATIIFLSNFFSLFTYPVTAYLTFRLIYSINKNIYASFLGGIIFGFSFYFLRYSGGALGLNQLWVVPLYFWGLIHCIKNGYKINDVLICSFIFSISFGISPYWGGYSLFFSPIFILGIGDTTLLNRVKNSTVLLICLSAIFVGINGEFLISNLGLLQTKEAHVQGFSVDHIGQMITHVYEQFIPQNRSIMHEYSKNLSYFYLGTVSLCLYFVYQIKYRNNKLINLFNICFILSIFASTYISALYGASDILYAYYLRLFRATTRLHLYSILFIAIISAEGLSQLMKKFSNKAHVIACIVLCLFILLENYSNEQNWLVSTNMSKLEALYLDIKSDPNVNVVINYPIFASKQYPVPQTIQYVAQILHEKTLVNGFNPQNKPHMQLLNKLDELKIEVIDTWQDIGVDMVVLYAKDIPDVDEKVKLLTKDARIKYVGMRTAQIDNHPKDSKLNSSIDIKMLRVARKLPNDYSRIIQYPRLILGGDYTQLSNSIYQLNFYKTGLQSLQLNYPFDARWRLAAVDNNILANVISVKDIAFISAQSGLNGKANMWSIRNYHNKKYFLFWLPDLYTLPFIYLRTIVILLYGIYFGYAITKRALCLGHTNSVPN